MHVFVYICFILCITVGKYVAKILKVMLYIYYATINKTKIIFCFSLYFNILIYLLHVHQEQVVYNF